MIGQPYKSRHDSGTVAGPATPDWYTYTPRHQAPPSPTGCPAIAEVASGDGEAGGLLVCSWDEHEGPGHYDEADGIFWTLAPSTAPEMAQPEPCSTPALHLTGRCACTTWTWTDPSPAGAVA